MKIKIPARTVEACDICSNEKPSSLLTKCLVCGKVYCHMCEAIICGCIHQPDVCKTCGAFDSVRAIVNRFVNPLQALLLKRDAALRRVRKPKRDRT